MNYGEFFLQLIVSSLEDYLELIRQAILLGVHCPNMYAKPDKDGMAISDYFFKLERQDAEQYLGLIVGTTKTWSDDNYEYEEDEELTKSTILKLDPNAPYLPPLPEDFPIIITWWYQNDSDRLGNSGLRLFHWKSLKNIQNSKGYLQAKYDLWNKTYAGEYQQLCEYQTKREQYLKGERNAHDWS